MKKYLNHHLEIYDSERDKVNIFLEWLQIKDKTGINPVEIHEFEGK